MEKRLVHGDTSFVIDVESDIEENRFASAFTKEPETIAWIDQVVQDGDVLLDVGANIGIFSLYAAARYPKIIVYACEPAYHNFYKLCMNTVANGLEERIHPMGFAFGDRAGAETINLSSLRSGSASHSVGARDAQKDSDRRTLSHMIATLTIDGLIAEGKMRKLNHIKIDVDGMEEAVINGAADHLQDPELRSILVELDWNLTDGKEVIRAIESAGFGRTHPLNSMLGHSRERRAQAGHGHIENIIFTRS